MVFLVFADMVALRKNERDQCAEGYGGGEGEAIGGFLEGRGGIRGGGFFRGGAFFR